MTKMQQANVRNRKLLLFTPSDVRLLKSVAVFPGDSLAGMGDLRFSEAFGWVPAVYGTDRDLPWGFRGRRNPVIRELRRRFLPARVRSKNTLLAHLLRTHASLPLTLAAHSHAKLAFDSVVMPSDFIDPAAIHENWQTGGRMLARWREELEKHEPWLAFWVQEDIVSLFYYLMQARSAALLGEGLIGHGVKEVALVEVKPMRVGYHDTPSDVTSAVLKEIFQERARVFSFEKPAPYERSLLNEPYERYALMQRKILFHAYTFEFDRWEQALRDIMQGARCECVLCIRHMGDNDFMERERERLQKKFGVPVLISPRGEGAKRPAAALVDLLMASPLNPFPYTCGLRRFFAFHVEERWVNLEALRALWGQILTDFPPALVIGSDVLEAEHCLPLMVAKQLAIPTLGMPHAALSAPMQLPAPEPFQTKACCFPFTAELFTQATAEKKRNAESFFNFNLDNEHAVAQNSFDLMPDTGTNILVITGPTEGKNAFFPYTSTRQQALFLAGLGCIPPKGGDDLRVYFKRHPGWPESEIFRLARIPQAQLLPLDSKLDDLLKRTAIMVSVNYIGSPGEQALRCGIPTVTLIPSVPPVSHPLLSLANAAGLLVHSVEECWEIIFRLLTDRAFREGVTRKQTVWHKEVFTPARNDLAAWVDKACDSGRGSLAVRSEPPEFFEETKRRPAEEMLP